VLWAGIGVHAQPPPHRCWRSVRAERRRRRGSRWRQQRLLVGGTHTHPWAAQARAGTALTGRPRLPRPLLPSGSPPPPAARSA
jgi:hypothetical protein